MHAPKRHARPAPHEAPHAPQFSASLRKLTHAPLHVVSRDEHADWQVPRLHTSPLAQALPHAPQLS
jgi:hypothetical protein